MLLSHFFFVVDATEAIRYIQHVPEVAPERASADMLAAVRKLLSRHRAGA